MPAGFPWSRYLKFTVASCLAMFAGSQTVHILYRPLQDLDELVEKEKERLKEEFGSDSTSNNEDKNS